MRDTRAGPCLQFLHRSSGVIFYVGKDVLTTFALLDVDQSSVFTPPQVVCRSLGMPPLTPPLGVDLTDWRLAAPCPPAWGRFCGLQIRQKRCEHLSFDGYCAGFLQGAFSVLVQAQKIFVEDRPPFPEYLLPTVLTYRIETLSKTRSLAVARAALSRAVALTVKSMHVPVMKLHAD